jgi:hypothetical protein
VPIRLLRTACGDGPGAGLERRRPLRPLSQEIHFQGIARPAPKILLRYKAQEAVERRYGNLKGPLAVAPMFLKNNRQIAALITVISLALLIFCLIEREARRNLAPETKVDGLYNRQPARPTRSAHPDRPGRPAADPGDRDQPTPDHQAQPSPGPAAGTARCRPGPPAVTQNPARRT